MCKICETNPVYEFTNQRKLCKRCFVNWFEKKFLYANRKFSMLKMGEVVAIKKDDGFRGVVLEYLLKNFSVRIGFQFGKKGKVAISETTDSSADKIVHSVIKGDLTKIKESAVEGKIIKPLYLFLDKEVKLYADLKGLKYKINKSKKDKISSFIDELELKHPEVKQAIIGSYFELN